MMRKTAIVLAAVAAVTFASAADVSARGGGGHGGGGHGGGGHGGGGHGGMGHAGFSSGMRGGPGGFAAFSGSRSVGSMSRTGSTAWNGNRFVGRGHVRHGHRFFRTRFAFFGAPYGYGYYDDCYARVWTRWGWRWQYVCY